VDTSGIYRIPFEELPGAGSVKGTAADSVAVEPHGSEGAAADPFLVRPVSCEAEDRNADG